MPKDPVTSGNAEAGVFAYVQAYAARSGRVSGSVDEAWTGSWSIAAGEVREKAMSHQLQSAHPVGMVTPRGRRLRPEPKPDYDERLHTPAPPGQP
ncbi:hypothetical protein GCM10010330_08750 [Streptomyces tendae]|nr:hypothetical protein GCM10010330_08750 [Streptomyces tendae]